MQLGCIQAPLRHRPSAMHPSGISAAAPLRYRHRRCIRAASPHEGRLAQVLT
jgi:hypothetical protein